VVLLCERSHAFEHNKSIMGGANPHFTDRFSVDYYFDEVFALSYTKTPSAPTNSPATAKPAAQRSSTPNTSPSNCASPKPFRQMLPPSSFPVKREILWNWSRWNC